MPKLADEINLKFVQLYREEECLWNASIPSYKDKQMRDSSLEKIRDILNKDGIEMSIKEIKNKIKNLRATYCQELTKIEKSERSGAGTAEVYKPKIIWFEEMHNFIKKVPMKRKTSNNQDSPNNNKDDNSASNSQSLEPPVAENLSEKTVEMSQPASEMSSIGDFNLPCISWDENGPVYLKRGPIEVQNSGINLIEELGFLGLTQHNTLKNYANNTLDLAFSNLPLKITNSSTPLVPEDRSHPAFTVDILDLKFKPLSEIFSPKRNYRKADYNSMNKYFSEQDWWTLLSTGSVDDAADTMYSIIYECIAKYVPYVKTHSKRSYPLWYSPALIKIIKEKSKAHTRWKKYGNHLDYDEFSLLRARERRVQAECFDRFTKRCEESIKARPKSFWSFVKAMRGGSNYPSSLKLGNTTYTDGKDICDAFNVFFKSVFGIPSNNYHPPCSDDPGINIISDIQTNFEEVLDRLQRLNISKGAGSDGIPPLFWVNCANSLALPITIIFNRSFKEGTFPACWKIANIIPVHKKGSRIAIENYRGISILSTISKILEQIVYDRIYPLISQSLSEHQHGFLKKRSAISNLACFTNYLFENIDRGGQVDVIYTDFEKAFDRVDHVILLHKLHTLGIRGNLLRWVQSYLTNRSQAVVLGGYRSDLVNIPTGVPQGSHLGPLFYNAYIYDIDSCLKNSKHLLYADDKKIFLKVRNEQDCKSLQDDLDRLYKYYKCNNISVNTKKCECITFTRKIKPLIYTYSFNGTEISRTDNVRDLGVYLDAKLSLSNHIDTICDKAFRNLGFVLRTCNPFNNIHVLKTVYFAYVRSIMEYASPIWSPQYILHKNRLERIQRIFINHLNYRYRKSPISYEDGCIKHGILTLEQRRIVLDQCLLFDILRGRIDSPYLLSGISFCTPTYRTRHTPLLYAPRHFTNYARNSVLSRITHSYNSSFNHLDLFHSSKYMFKKDLVKSLNSSHS